MSLPSSVPCEACAQAHWRDLATGAALAACAIGLIVVMVRYGPGLVAASGK